jgi:hypothetical protein
LKCFSTLVFVILVLAASAGEATAAVASNGTITITPAPTVGNGSITAQGTYTVINGYMPSTSVFLTAFPVSGGLGAQANNAPLPAGGTWGATTISNLPVGKYYVYATLQIKKGATTELDFSPIVLVNVTNAGGNPVTPVATIAFGAGDPNVPAAGQIAVGNMGTYNITGAGYQATGCALTTIPVNGGVNIQGFLTGGPAPKANWGSITTNVPAGQQYMVVGSVTFQLGAASQIIYTPITNASFLTP